MADEKKCPFCGKKLRADNTKGVCGKCQSNGKRLENAPRGDAGDDQVLERTALPKTPPKSDAVKRFRVVAEAMGYDADELLATYAEGWLAAVKQSVDQLERPASE